VVRKTKTTVLIRTAVLIILCVGLWFLHGCKSEEDQGVSKKSDYHDIGTGDNTGNSSLSQANNTPPAVHIDRPLQGSTFTEGDSAALITGIGKDQEDGPLAGNSLQWWVSKWWSSNQWSGSDVDDYVRNPLAWGPSFSPGNLSSGQYIITLIAADSVGLSSSDSINIRICSKCDADSQQPKGQNQKANVVVQGIINRLVDDQGHLVLLGELKNIGCRDATFCKITFTLLDSSLQPIGDPVFAYVHGTNKTITQQGIEDNAILEPGACGGFYLPTNVPDESVSLYDYKISYQEDETSSPGADLVVDCPIEPGANETDGFLKLSGRIRNRGSKTALFSQITFILKDRNDMVIDVISADIQGSFVYLPDIDAYTDTAVLAGKKGVFTAKSLRLYPNEVDFDRSYYTLTWRDCQKTISSRASRQRGVGLSAFAKTSTALCHDPGQRHVESETKEFLSWQKKCEN